MQLLLKKALTEKSARTANQLTKKLLLVSSESFNPWEG